MLGRTANGLFWMYRYLERAENTSRLIETGQRIALTRLRTSDDEWRSVMESAGSFGAFDAQDRALTKDAAIDWMVRERDLPAGLPVETVRTAPDEDSLLELLSGLTGKSLFSNALTLDGLVSLWQPSAR